MAERGSEPDRTDAEVVAEARQLLVRYIDGTISRDEYDNRIAELNLEPQPSTYTPGTPEYEVAQVEAGMHFDDVWLTPEERDLLLRRARGEITPEEYAAEVEERVFGDEQRPK